MTLEYNPESNTMQPTSEVVMLMSTPNYVVENEEIKKKIKLEEFRFKTTLEGINSLIGQLKLLSNTMNTFTQLGESLNTVLSESLETIKE